MASWKKQDKEDGESYNGMKCPKTHDETLGAVDSFHYDDERRARRKIANYHERVRMQGINAGFHKLKEIINIDETEKLSKAGILSLAAEYINHLEAVKNSLESQNSRLKQLVRLKDERSSLDITDAQPNVAPSVEMRTTVEADDLPNLNEEELRDQLDKERRYRIELEGLVGVLESQLCPDLNSQIEMPQHMEDGQGVSHDDSFNSSAEIETAVSYLKADYFDPLPVTEAPIEDGATPETEIIVQRWPQTNSITSDQDAESNVYLASTSRQNLDTIMEAIRHLEGNYESEL